MKLLKEGNRWVAQSTFSEKDVPKAAGFRWDPNLRPWWTDQAEKALKLRAHGDDEVQSEIDRLCQQTIKSLEQSRATDAQIDIPVPEGLNYMPFQKAGIQYASSRPSTLIGDEMGLGKTIQAIGVINLDPTIRTVLVVCPASLKLNWARELQKWSVRPINIKVADSVAKKTRIFEDQNPQIFAIVVNYDIIDRFPDIVAPDLTLDLVVVDECHYIKNTKTKRSKLVHQIKGKRRILLTGTPICNRPVELFSIISYLDPATWKNFFWYTKRYCGAYKTQWGWDFSGASHLDELQDKLRGSIMVRRLKSEVLTELPPKVRQVVELPANGAASAVSAELEAWDRFGSEIDSLQARVELSKCEDDPGAYESAVRALQNALRVRFEEISRLRHKTAVAKIPQVIEQIEIALENGSKIVCFAHHHDVIDAIADHFGEAAVKLTGRDNIDVRQKAVDGFQNDPKIRLFVGSIQAAGVGITLTASAHVIFAELDWVPGNVSQAEDRTHRIGQKNSVFVQHLVVDGSLDAKMAKTIVAKQNVIDKALDSEERSWLAVPQVEEVATKSATKKQIEKDAEGITDSRREAIHEGLRILAQMDPDGARLKNEIGFNSIDGRIGHSLAMAHRLSNKQAALGLRIIQKYHRQLGPELISQAKG